MYKQENPPTRHLDPKCQELPRPCPIIPLTGLSFWASTAPQKQATQPARKPYQVYTEINSERLEMPASKATRPIGYLYQNMVPRGVLLLQ